MSSKVLLYKFSLSYLDFYIKIIIKKEYKIRLRSVLKFNFFTFTLLLNHVKYLNNLYDIIAKIIV